MNSPYTPEQISKKLKETLQYDFRIGPEEATSTQIYKALSKIVVEYMREKRHSFMTKCNSMGKKQVYYISMEFLMGRSLKTSLYNLGLNETVEKVLKDDYKIKPDAIYDEEPDAGLGNGGLGRLAACYMDGMATCDYPATGYSLLYEYGIFKQKIIDGWQTELADDWLPGGGSWLTKIEDQAIEVHFDGEVREYWDNDYHHISHVNYNTVLAVPYDMYVSGYDSEGISKLRLWSAKSMSFDMNAFNAGDYTNALGASNIAHSLTKVLYPNDNHLEGKALRLRQQYFMCAASVGDIVMRHMNIYGTLENLPDKVAIHINDTHPTLAIPELMRILLDDCGYSFRVHEPYGNGGSARKVGSEPHRTRAAENLHHNLRDQQTLLRKALRDSPGREGQRDVDLQEQSDKNGYTVRCSFSLDKRRFQAAQRDHQGQRVPR